MNPLTIMIIAYNEFEWVKESIESIRRFNDVENLQVIVVDNCSEDGLREWAGSQEDFTYIFVEEGVLGYGKLINEVMDLLKVDTDLLVMEGHYLLTPACLSRLQRALCQDDSIGAVGCVSNSFSYHQRSEGDELTYEGAVERTLGLDYKNPKKVLGLSPNIILFKEEALRNTGRFDEDMFGMVSVMSDYCFRMLLGKYELAVCPSALMWDIVPLEYYKEYTNRFSIKTDHEYLEKKWGMRYFQFLYNENLVSMIDERENAEFSLLEIGCDCGATLLEIKNRYPNAKLSGCDINEKAVKVASCVVDAFVSNIEDENLPYEKNSLDYIIFGDVLEHLHNPERTLKYCCSLLKKDGFIVASIPNLMHISVMKQLLKGNFTYTENGLLDKTHIHLFTGNEILKTFNGAGLMVTEMGSATIGLEEGDSALIERLLSLDKDAKRHMYETFQYVVKAKKNL